MSQNLNNRIECRVYLIVSLLGLLLIFNIIPNYAQEGSYNLEVSSSDPLNRCQIPVPIQLKATLNFRPSNANRISEGEFIFEQQNIVLRTIQARPQPTNDSLVAIWTAEYTVPPSWVGAVRVKFRYKVGNDFLELPKQYLLSNQRFTVNPSPTGLIEANPGQKVHFKAVVQHPDLLKLSSLSLNEQPLPLTVQSYVRQHIFSDFVSVTNTSDFYFNVSGYKITIQGKNLTNNFTFPQNTFLPPKQTAFILLSSKAVDEFAFIFKTDLEVNYAPFDPLRIDLEDALGNKVDILVTHPDRRENTLVFPSGIYHELPPRQRFQPLYIRQPTGEWLPFSEHNPWGSGLDIVKYYRSRYNLHLKLDGLTLTNADNEINAPHDILQKDYRLNGLSGGDFPNCEVNSLGFSVVVVPPKPPIVDFSIPKTTINISEYGVIVDKSQNRPDSIWIEKEPFIDTVYTQRHGTKQSLTIKFKSSGTYSLKYYVKNQAGTAISTIPIVFTVIDNLPPLITSATLNYTLGCTPQPRTLTIKISDVGSGVKQVSCTVQLSSTQPPVRFEADYNPQKEIWIATLPANLPGQDALVWVNARDHANNQSTSDTLFYTSPISVLDAGINQVTSQFGNVELKAYSPFLVPLLFTKVVVNRDGYGILNPNSIPVTNFEKNFIEITNYAKEAVSLEGYRLEILGVGARVFTFPESAVVPSGRSVVVHIGRGADQPDKLYYHTGGLVGTINSYSQTGFILRGPGNLVVDAVALNGFRFGNNTGVSKIHWNSDIYLTNYLGIYRTTSFDPKIEEWRVPSWGNDTLTFGVNNYYPKPLVKSFYWEGLNTDKLRTIGQLRTESKFFRAFLTLNAPFGDTTCAFSDSVRVLVVRQSKIIAGFVADKRRPVINQIVTLTDTSTGYPSDRVWEIWPKSFVILPTSDLTQKVLKIRFLEAGFYNIKLKASNTNFSDELTKDQYIYVTPHICVPTYIDGTIYGDFINGVKLNNLSNLNTGGVDGKAYTYYQSENLTARLKANSNYRLEVQNGDSANTIAAWLYDPTEINPNFMKLGEVSGQSYNFVSIPISIGFVNANKILRLRIRSVYGEKDLSPCALYEYGETEDYDVFLESSCPSLPNNYQLLDTFLFCGTGKSKIFETGLTNYTHDWSTGGTQSKIEYSFTDLKTKTLYVRLVSPAGCSYRDSVVLISIFPAERPVPDSLFLCDDKPKRIYAKPPHLSGIKYIWSNGSTEPFYEHKRDSPANLSLKIMHDNSDCETSYSVHVSRLSDNNFDPVYPDTIDQFQRFDLVGARVLHSSFRGVKWEFDPSAGITQSTAIEIKGQYYNQPGEKVFSYTIFIDTCLLSKTYKIYVRAKNLRLPNQNKPKVSVFPNPFSDEVNIKSDIPFNRVRIYDSAGRTVVNEGLILPIISFSLNLQPLTKGTYTLELSHFDHCKTISKLIKP